MMTWAAPVVALAALLTGVVAFRRLPTRPALGVFLVAMAVTLAVFRMFAIAGPLALFGFVLLQQGLKKGATPSPGQASEVRTRVLTMRLDHDTGEMDGDVIAGPFAGGRLSRMEASDLQELVSWVEAEADEDSLSLLLAYLDRCGGTGEDDRGRAETFGDALSMQEAYRILGLKPGASVEEVREAHKRLIRKVHPDLGGSSALASMINAAREKLDPS